MNNSCMSFAVLFLDLIKHSLLLSSVKLRITYNQDILVSNNCNMLKGTCISKIGLYDLSVLVGCKPYLRSYP